MGVLSKTEIIRRIKDEDDYREKLLITPLLSEEQIGPASVDVRLGTSIVVPKRTYVESQDVTDPELVRQVEQRRYDRITLRYHESFILHPNGIILGVTFEYLVLPYNIFGTIASRSSWGRLGLVIATASVIHPGFKGCLTLELANLSESPIVLYPGLLVGQMILYDLTFPDISPDEEKLASPYEGRYDCPTEAGLPSFYTNAKSSDDEMRFWRKLKDNSPSQP